MDTVGLDKKMWFQGFVVVGIKRVFIKDFYGRVLELEYQVIIVNVIFLAEMSFLHK